MKDKIKNNEWCLNYLFDFDQRDPDVQDVYHKIITRIINLEKPQTHERN